MNAQQALDLATDHGITVTVDSEVRDGSKLNKIIGTKFKVGEYLLSSSRGSRLWAIVKVGGGAYCYPSGPKCGKTILLPRGDAMQFAIELTLGLELTAYSKGD
jgi:hypothetical protein